MKNSRKIRELRKKLEDARTALHFVHEMLKQAEQELADALCPYTVGDMVSAMVPAKPQAPDDLVQKTFVVESWHLLGTTEYILCLRELKPDGTKARSITKLRGMEVVKYGGD